jgi:trimethylamine--corrinoid protein Co-methyltransferase
MEMMKVVLGDHPQVSLGASPVSPLNFLGDIVQVLLEIARQGLPCGPLPCPSVGATSPMSLAGSLVQQNAEVLASIVLVQLVMPGLPVVYCGRLSALNMRNGSPIWGNPEVGMMSAATVKIGHYYHLPVNVYGLADSGYAPDMQNGYERAINALIPALSGADELSGVGEMAGGVCSSNAQIVIDNDIYGMIQRILRGFPVNEDSLAVEVIGRVMDTTHNYLRELHTRKYLRAGEIWQGRLGIQEIGWEMWQAAGCPTVVERAQGEVERLLNEHEVPPLSEEQGRELDRIISQRVQA